MIKKKKCCGKCSVNKTAMNCYIPLYYRNQCTSQNTNVKLFKIALIIGKIVISNESKSLTPGIPEKTAIAPMRITESAMIIGL